MVLLGIGALVGALVVFLLHTLSQYEKASMASAVDRIEVLEARLAEAGDRIEALEVIASADTRLPPASPEEGSATVTPSRSRN